ncbi:MAG: hypothetical protein CO186_06315 [Zetaproteobacteria bacterium CG_4_9_14_3_um_filter_49_83]|nr:MAG: hypothetical protein AUJ56_11655 [Zetaproteobacteria bacterium CG1_02_49_23]PIQ34158.1 MAG: hypothetical protein COW62_02790 [Zetaproteobacteria bacterium CG17_big_fil_post_rev_8_21_14_2_50_50_13]PIV31220.1 MAG: hypothetical protein COS35_02485 [Zetaproteobacteria bacterium CG02_land_8_20_14_3_00_50_9]PIY56933.1 MAG: hypothetical protein COZ00_01465 [Zetaproteobacteria bacterium CG_4_10_14_0_8_um_filter_49_80]PJA35330.1 MAG: hypothetical protein CO186_06315 [Zetaproteobacteria bacterium
MRKTSMNAWLRPAHEPSKRCVRIMIPVLLAISAAFIYCAPLLMPEDYSWISHVISESAAQNLPGAWVARSGFIVFGFAVLWLAVAHRSTWVKGAYICHMAFGIFMISTAAFSHKPWLEGVPYGRGQATLNA